MRKILLLFAALIFIVSCSKGAGPKGNYVLKVDGTTLSKEDVQSEMNSLPDMAKQFFAGPEGTSRFVDELSKKEMLYLEAKKRGLENNKDFQKRVEDFKKINLINQLLEKEIEATTKVTEKDAQEYYDSHKAEFTMRNEVRLGQILLKNEDDAKKAYERVRKGEDFAKVATAMSIDKKSAKAGGFMGSFKKGELAPEIEEAIFRLKDGEVSTPVKLKDGIHIFRVVDIKGPVVKFEDVKDMVMHRLTGEKQKGAFDKFIENLKKTYKVDINKAELAKVPAMQPQVQGGGQMPIPSPHPLPKH
ncbi:MAG: peptidyl-prolyl cis-trans isomerase [Nitrospirae bacterium]|nr:peptidyl-prolyl cis-trans isomerase [Nitrospirota bacterium]